MRRRPDRAVLALMAPLLLFVAFGAARVDAPVSVIGLLFDRPGTFALVTLALALGGAVLLFVRPLERRVARVFAPARAPALWSRVRRSGRAVEGGTLLRCYTGNPRIEGSNPSLSAIP